MEESRIVEFLISSRRRGWLLGFLLVAATVLAYQPARHGDFIWDDDVHLTHNPCIVGPLGFKEIWTTPAARICPLVISSFWLQHSLWGLNPLPYHLVNIAMHAVCAILLWRVLWRLNVRGAWLGAALWALHPVQVETVAWITELKNTQSCLFYLLAILFFVKWRAAEVTAGGRRREQDYALALFCAALAMASKSSTVILPIVLGLSWWWLEGRWRWRNAPRLAPFILMSILASAWSMRSQDLEGANDPEWARSGFERLVTAGKVVWFYLDKLLWPHPLMFVYPRWTLDAWQLTAYLPVLAVAIGLVVLWWNRQGSLRPVFFAFAYYLVALLPVLGLVDHFYLRYSFVGDHFQYLAGIGPLALAAASLATVISYRRTKAWLGAALCGALLLALGVLTWQQCGMYADIETLWRTTLARNPGCSMAHNNLGTVLDKKGRLDEAISQFQEAIRLQPGDALGHNNLGVALVRKGQLDEAISQYQEAIRLKPDNAAAHYNLGIALGEEGQLDEAISQYQEAIRLKPGYALGHNNLGNALVRKGQIDEAIRQFQEAIRLKPDYSEAHNNLGIALGRKGQIDEAIRRFQEAIRLKADYAEAHNNLGSALVRKGQIDQAISQFQETIRLKPDYAEAHYNLGIALVRKGQIDQAISQFQEALKLQPDFAQAKDNLLGALRFKEASARQPAPATEP